LNLKRVVRALTDDMGVSMTEQQLLELLTYFYDFKNVGGTAEEDLTFTLSGTGVVLQDTWGAIGTTVSLKEKTADADGSTWIAESKTVVGVPGDLQPSAIVEAWLAELAAYVVDRGNGNVPVDPTGAAIAQPYISADGRDYSQLLEKFLVAAVAYSQATDDYLVDGVVGKGMGASNLQAGTALYTGLEHAWDEGFGYFGAPRDFDMYTDDEAAAAGGRPEYQYGYFDSNGDGSVDLTSEFVFSPAGYAAKRDIGSGEGDAAKDFTDVIFSAFVEGRTFITSVDGELSPAQLDELRVSRDAISTAWDELFASNIIHYLNRVLVHHTNFGTANYNYAQHAGHWSEMKAFALALQFNPDMMMSTTDFATLHTLIGQAPVLPNADPGDIAAYKEALLDARDLIVAAYSIHADNVGDDDGLGGY